ncbi:uncharacterized protein (UPF0276 family) [Caulobacter ginsengisoli]|uniref:UPF0276 protein QO010_001333 n=1 Tax=Caulobacter ginsengisoli TaxID=400775 RepID=A0ABU0IRK1_9CAUL|nr:DUF692 domain-containing protein [Caulobacter ginsengisoli]MDQ0463562.1 uncharacterized protein (UPF0276 family) [Caulobacter ginsengisoli]
MRAAAGLGFKPEHFDEAMTSPAADLWFEVHPENYMMAGGPRLKMLEALRRRRPLSLHGVGLSLAADCDPDPDHLDRLKRLVDRFQPDLVSEHLAWSAWNGAYLPDLLPFPRTAHALERLAANIGQVQDHLGRAILIENPSLYLALDGHEMDEVELLTTLVRRTGCGLLVDVNNIHVSASNLGLDPHAYLDALPAQAIGEIHLAGHRIDPDGSLLIDSHDAPVAPAVWALFRRLIARIGPRPTLIERDANLPPFTDLMVERAHAEFILDRAREAAPKETAIA